MDALVAKSLLNSCSYEVYRSTVSGLLADGKVSGETQSEALLHYTLLNETRMNRLEKTLVVPPAVQEKLQRLDTSYTWLVISEGWCGDAAQIIPALKKMEDAGEKVTLRFVFRDENPELMDRYLTNGGRSIPKLLLLETGGSDVIASWGPRPSEAVKLVADYKAAHGAIDDQLKTDLQLWYLQDKGLSTMNEIVTLFPQK